MYNRLVYFLLYFFPRLSYLHKRTKYWHERMIAVTEYQTTRIRRLFAVSRIVTLQYRELPKGYENMGERHDFWELLYVDRGQIAVDLDGEWLNLSQGQMVLYRPGAFHSNRGRPLEQSAGVGIVSFVCPSKAMEDLKKSVYRPNLYQRQLLGDMIARAQRCLEPVSQKTGRRGMALRSSAPPQDLQAIVNQLELLLISFWEQQEEGEAPFLRNNQMNLEDSLALKIEAYLKEDLSRRVSLEEIGSRFGVSVSYVKQLFRRRFGRGVIDHYRRLRIAEAKRLICEGDGNFTQIADQLGFGSVHYFSRVFFEVTGVRPSEYAKSIVYGESYE